MNKYYESVPFISYKIKGEKPPELTRAIEEELKSNFDLIQEPFEKVVKVVAPALSHRTDRLLALVDIRPAATDLLIDDVDTGVVST